MSNMHTFDILFKGLASGLHHFEWSLDDDFFAAFESDEIHGGTVQVGLELEKSAAGLGLEFVIEGMVRVDCDRCAEECEVPVEFDGGFRVRTSGVGESVKGGKSNSGKGSTSGECDFDGEIMWLAEGEGVLNVAQYLYESVILSLPMQRTHPDCKPAGVRFVSEEEFVRAEHGSEMQKMSDNPEWQKLEELKAKL